MPTTAEQVHLYDIVVPDSTTATDIKSRIDAGEDFMTIASEVSLDTATKDKGGDMGWVPLKALDANLANTVTNLDIGKVSDPVQTSTAAQEANLLHEQKINLIILLDGYREISITGK